MIDNELSDEDGHALPLRGELVAKHDLVAAVDSANIDQELVADLPPARWTIQGTCTNAPI